MGTPSPLVYWNHLLGVKTQSNLLESVSCGQNLDNIRLSSWLSYQKSHLRTASAAMIGYWGCG